MNASDDRNPTSFKIKLEAATQMSSVTSNDSRPNCLVIDEIDGAPVVSNSCRMLFCYSFIKCII